MMSRALRGLVALGLILIGLLSASATVVAWQDPAAETSRKNQQTKVEAGTADLVRTFPIPSRNGGAVAYAMPLKNMTIDGKLDDWPADAERLPIKNLLNYPARYGLNGLDKVELSDNPNLSASFLAGYSKESGVIYLAIIVRDDKHIVDFESPFKTDSVEIFIDGKRSDIKIPAPEDPWEEHIDASQMPVLQYVGVAGNGAAYANKEGTNYTLKYGKIANTKTRMAYQTTGDLTVYEWAIQAFDQYPDSPTVLKPGKRIGLDIAVVDNDGGDSPSAWMCWGPLPNYFKGFNSSNLGDLILGEAP
ncbi:MAG: sugar-binding protein [Paludisphaera borealis]|uniref:sugar-binding protein n=1 Tax=Paludisphaera borealis TaxID=1387353 RepID=UPI00284089BD|nr:sugar-binding protein [Paludisphaera borealis]MDR3620312.1 sugar-binding protein [Paludisphaera borealis]